MPRMARLRRFLLLAFLPALVTCVGLTQLARDARDERRDGMLSRVGGMLAAAVQSELADAWGVLEQQAAAVTTIDTSLVAVRRALTGDTIRSLATDPAGARASVLLPRGDTLVSATAVVRSPTLAAVSEVPGLHAALYLRGVRLQASGGAATDALPAELAAEPGWNATPGAGGGVWVSPATASSGAAASELVVAVRPAARIRPVASLRTLAATTALLLLALVLVAAGGPRASGRMVAGATLVTLTTGVVAVWVAIGEGRRSSADGARELAWVADLVEARGLLDDPVAAQSWAGSVIYRAEGDRLVGTPGRAPPAFVGSLPRPEPGRPASGAAVDGTRWRVVASGEGRTIFLGSPVDAPPLLPLALLGTLVTVLGSIAVVRAVPAPANGPRVSAGRPLPPEPADRPGAPPAP